MQTLATKFGPRAALALSAVCDAARYCGPWMRFR